MDAIRVEALSKRYRLGQSQQRGYTALRDVLAARFGRLLSGAQTRGPGTPETDFWALRDVDFSVAQGEKVGIIGRNGAGKSTLLKILSRITEPTTGRVSLRGRMASLLEVGTGFHPELTGRENVLLNGAILGMSSRETMRKFDAIVEFAEVEKFLDTPVKRYSSGMYMRLAFAVAAHLQPDILVVDEVLAVGDTQFQRRCLGKMEDIGREGRTVLFVSHNMAAILALCDRAIMLSSGRIAATGTAEAVVAGYLAQREARTSLRERIDRTGSGVARIVELALLEASGAAAESVRADEPVVFEMIVEAGSAEVGKPISVVLVVSDRNENRVFSLYTDWVAPEMKLNSARMRLSCTVAGGVMLAPDGYSVTAGILVNGVVADKMANALDFEVVTSNVMGAGAIPSSGLGACLVRHNWKIEA